MATGCEAFRQNLDALMDGELSAGERLEMERHAGECEACAQLMAERKAIAAACAQLGEDISVPLAAQAAWRRAVRAEAKKKAPLAAWTRGIAGLAAAMVVLVMSTYGVRMNESVPVSPNSAAVLTTDLTGYDVYGPGERHQASGGYALTGAGLQSDGSTGSQKSGTGETAGSEVETVVLRSATRSIESDSYDSDIQWLQDLVSEYEAYFEERSETAASEDGTAGRTASAVIRVPSDRLDDFLMELDQLGRTVLRSEAAEDVTGRYMDTQSRLDALKLQKEKLDEMLAAAESVEELIAIDDKLTDVIASMESLEGDIRRWESQRNYSRVTLTLTEKAAAPAASNASLGERMKAGFGESVVWLNEFGQDALVTLAAAAPRLVVWIPALALVIILICAIARKRR